MFTRASRLSRTFNRGVAASLKAHAARAGGNHVEAERLDREALSHFDAALAIDPSHLPALSGKAMTTASLGATLEAARLFQRALEIDASNYENLRQLGLCFIELGNVEDAREVTLKAVAMARSRAYAKSAAVEVYNFGGHIMTIAAGHRDSGHRQDEVAAYELARQVFSLSKELDPSLTPTLEALQFIESLPRQ